MIGIVALKKISFLVALEKVDHWVVFGKPGILA